MTSDRRRILICDDDTQLAGLTSEYLEAKGFNVTTTTNAIEGYKKFIDGNFAMCILDVKMPMKTGFELAAEIREVNTTVPIIFLTGEVQTEKRIEGLSLGADDYLTKPFSFKELHLRMEAIFRRLDAQPKSQTSILPIGKYAFNLDTRTLSFEDEELRLSEIEARVLEAFCKASNGRVTRDYLLTSIWQDEAHLKSRSLNVYISKLRKRLEKDPAIEILNVHGSGYHLVIS